MGGISLLFWRLSLNVCWSLALWLVFNREPPRPSLGPFSFLRGKHPLFSVSALCVCVCVCECVAVGLRTVPVSSLKLHPYVAWCPQVQSLPQNEQVEGQCLWLGCERINETQVSQYAEHRLSGPSVFSQALTRSLGTSRVFWHHALFGMGLSTPLGHCPASIALLKSFYPLFL